MKLVALQDILKKLSIYFVKNVGVRKVENKEYNEEKKNQALLEWYSKKLKEKQAEKEKLRAEKAVKQEEVFYKTEAKIKMISFKN